MDVGDDEAVSEGFDCVLQGAGRIDALVVGAGFGLAGPVELTTIDEAKAQFETNFFGAVRCVKAALPPMRHNGGGKIILVSSIGGVIGIPFQAFYSASKFALEGYGESLAYEVAPFGIHVTMIEPGNIKTDFTGVRKFVASNPKDNPYAATAAHAISLMERDEQRGAPAMDVARAIEKTLGAKRPKRRFSVGKPGERIGIPAKRLLSHRLFEMGAKSSLGV
jgi:NAD(P)-dependent dehydrogenase (short-subunit alcohol dehydrogenase family)